MKAAKNNDVQVIENGTRKKVKKMDHPIAFEDDPMFKF